MSKRNLLIMHSMVGAFSPYAVKRRRAGLVGGYCYRFFQCSFPCGIVMLILAILFILAGASQLIYINHLNGCNLSTNENIETTDHLSTKSFKCNRQTIRVLGITCVVTGSVLFLISLLVIKYSRTGEEDNVIRTTTSSLLANNSRNSNTQSHHPSTHYHHVRSSSIQDPTTNIVISVR